MAIVPLAVDVHGMASTLSKRAPAVEEDKEREKEKDKKAE